MRRTIRFIAAVDLVLAIVRPASAHALGAEAKLKGERVEVEAYYSDNTPAREARVSVVDSAEKTVVEGRTDEQGRWYFARPAAGRYHVAVDAGDGHRARITVTIPAGDSPATTVAAAPGDPACEYCTEADGGTVSSGPNRAEFTRFPWQGVTLGLAAITLAAFGWRAFRRPVRTV